MASETKAAPPMSDFEVDSTDAHLQSKTRMLRVLESVRMVTTTLALLMSLAILGVSADTLSVYRHTTYSPAFLSLWPASFNLQPTVTLAVGGAIVAVTNAVSLFFCKVPSLRSNFTPHKTLSFVAPLVAFVAALVAMAFFYTANASFTTDTLLSWSCRWRQVPMRQSPRWGQLCHESWAGVYLSVLLIPVEALVFGVAVCQSKRTCQTTTYRKGSPVLSQG